jgi:succinate dehydrogenase flavin-adding protein (antitoxin of CptAB toxin-antitoxin module)
MGESRDIRIKRLIYQSWYRGCKETDRLLGHFAKAHLEELDDQELDDFEALLAEDDHDIFRWLTGKGTIPEKYKESAAFKMLLSYNYPGGGA